MSETERVHAPSPELQRFRPLKRRRKLLIVALAVATAVSVVSMLLDPPGRPEKPRDAQVRECRDGRGSDCVGGKAQVLVVPVAPAGSAAR